MLEQLLTEVIINEQLFQASRNFEGKFTKKDIRELQTNLLIEIADWFHDIAGDIYPEASSSGWLHEFARKVRAENAGIISFNWDLIFDQLFLRDRIDGSFYGLS